MGAILTYFFGHVDDDIFDLKTGLSNKDKRLVKETWDILRKDSINTGVLIMISYFQKYPQYHKVFHAFKDIPVDQLAANTKFQAHCLNIMNTLNNAIDALNDADLMQAILYSTGEKHGRRGQGRQEFIDLKGVMMDVMKDNIKSKFSTEVEASWSKTIDILFSKIFRGIDGDASSSRKLLPKELLTIPIEWPGERCRIEPKDYPLHGFQAVQALLDNYKV